MTSKEHLDLMEKKFADMLALCRAKNADYNGQHPDAFNNFKMVERLGVCSAEEGILVRMSDKMSRIASLLGKEAQVKDEAVTDTLLDLCVYSMILSNYLDSKRVS